MNLRPELTGALQQKIIEKTAFNGEFTLVPGWKIDNHFADVERNELDRVQFGMRQILYTTRETETFQHGPARWIQTIAAHFFPGKFFPLKNKRPQICQRAKRRAYGSSGSASHDHNVKRFHSICNVRLSCRAQSRHL